MSADKRFKNAREAYTDKNLEASALAHDPQAIKEAFTNEKHGGSSSQYIGEMVYGGLDGIITTFAVVSGVAGAQLGSHVVLIMGLANLFADGFSMAIGSFLSTRSEQEYYQRERSREAWEVEHFPKGEKMELIELYRQNGYSDEEANTLVDIQSRQPERWVDAMMVDELKMMPIERNPLLNGLATFISFLVAGSVPLLVYVYGLFAHLTAKNMFPISVGFSALALFGLGAAKVRITERNALKSGLETLAVGGLAAIAAYLVGVLLKGIGA